MSIGRQVALPGLEQIEGRQIDGRRGDAAVAAVTSAASASATDTQRNLLRAGDGGPRHVRMAIVGSGFGGLCMAIKLKQAGVHDFVILERADNVGGTWRDNTYPGCECDVPSHLYSFSFEPEPNWPRPFAGHADIQAYIERCADKYGLLPHVQFNANLSRAVFDERRNLWRLETTQGPLVADTIASATGGLSNPSVPELKGLARFEGRHFHSARWDHGYDFSGKRVAVIGTGASTIQFLPEIAKEADTVTLFQRTPAWVLPKRNRPFGPRARWILKHIPLARRLYRALIFMRYEMFGLALQRPHLMDRVRPLAIGHIKTHIKDDALRRLLTPDYTPGCKRILLSNDYYPALARDNVRVTGSPIEEIRAHGIVTADGEEHDVDAIVFGTGFEVGGTRQRASIVGRGGIDQRELMKDHAEAYLGTLVAGFPNYFWLGGPNAGLGHNSIIYMLEGAVRQTMQALKLMDKRAAAAIEVTPEAQAAYNRDVQAKLQGTVWTSGCASYYRSQSGKVTAIWPGSAFSYKRATRRLNERHLRLTPRAPS